MSRKQRKKLLSFFLSFLMVAVPLSTAGYSVYASDLTDESEVTSENGSVSDTENDIAPGVVSSAAEEIGPMQTETPGESLEAEETGESMQTEDADHVEDPVKDAETEEEADSLENAESAESAGDAATAEESADSIEPAKSAEGADEAKETAEEADEAKETAEGADEAKETAEEADEAKKSSEEKPEAARSKSKKTAAVKADETAKTVEDPVAVYGATGYETLQSAVNAAGISETPITIVLQKDTVEDIVIGDGQNIILDLNGNKITNQAEHTITVQAAAVLTVQDTSADKSGTVDNIMHRKAALYNYGAVTLTGGTFDRSQEAGRFIDLSVSFVTEDNGNSYYTIVNETGTMEIKEGVTVQQAGGAKDPDYGYKGFHSSLIVNGYPQNGQEAGVSLTISGGDFYGGKHNVKNEAYSTLDISGGRFHENSSYTIYNYGTASISGGTFTSWNTTVVGNGVDGIKPKGTLEISGGTFNAVNKDGRGMRATTDNAKGCATTVTGGEFGNQFIDYFVDNNKFTVDNPDYIRVKLDPYGSLWTVVPKSAYPKLNDLSTVIAERGGEYYSDLKKALDDAKTAESDGKTVTLLANISVSQTMVTGDATLDLNGHTITGKSSSNYALYVNAGKLIVSDSKGNGKITGGSYAPVCINGGSAVLNSGAITGNTHGIVVNGKESVFEMNGGAVKSEDYALIIQNEATAVLNDGTIDAKDYTIFMKTKGNFRMTGGSVTSNYRTVYIGTGKASIVMEGGSMITEHVTASSDEE